ncbi:MAG: YebC/PmpR family DNA-binding transcriptional regulator [Ardenticatenales bacterium]|nr:YebC/PmpR family DNA-binding transcriptional regulator [Ardenticatenales bacterium]
MAGHSKWANIKHRKAATDAKKGKVYTKMAREIESAARQGGGEPESNYTLRLAIDKAKGVNMPNDNIARAIKRGTGELQGDAFEEIYYEGYGPNGTAIIFKCLTDNRNRTVGELRSTLKKGGGTLAESGAVAWQFENKGIITIPLEGNDPDEIMLLAIDAGAEDVEVEDDIIEVVTARTDLQKVAEELKKNGIQPENVELAMVPQHLVSLSVEEQLQAMGLIERLEELDDVQEIYTNIDFTQEAMEAAG